MQSRALASPGGCEQDGLSPHEPALQERGPLRLQRKQCAPPRRHAVLGQPRGGPRRRLLPRRSRVHAAGGDTQRQHVPDPHRHGPDVLAHPLPAVRARTLLRAPRTLRLRVLRRGLSRRLPPPARSSPPSGSPPPLGRPHEQPSPSPVPRCCPQRQPARTPPRRPLRRAGRRPGQPSSRSERGELQQFLPVHACAPEPPHGLLLMPGYRPP